jgi:uncharacterized protein YicC (UPF0701 family)
MSVALMLSGCGNSHDSLMGKMVSTMEQTADVLESIKDEESAKAAEPKLKKLGERMESLKEQVDEMDDPSPEVEKQLKEKYEKRVKEALGKLMREGMRIGMNPELSKHVRDVTSGMQGGF